MSSRLTALHYRLLSLASLNRNAIFPHLKQLWEAVWLRGRTGAGKSEISKFSQKDVSN